MFKSHDAVKQQSADTADNTSSILSNFAMESMKAAGSNQSVEQQAANEQDDSVLEFGPVPGLDGPKPGQIPVPPSVYDQLETQIRLDDITPDGSDPFDVLSRQLNRAFAAGDLNEFTNVLGRTSDVSMRSELVSMLDERLHRLEPGQPGETELFNFGSTLEFCNEQPGNSLGIKMDLNTLESTAIDASITRQVTVNDRLYSTVVDSVDMPYSQEYKGGLFRSLAQGESKSIASSDAPLGLVMAPERQ